MPVQGEFFQNPGSSGGFYEYQIEQSARFDSGSSSYLSQTFSSAGNRRTGSVSVWVKRSTLGTNQCIFCPYSNDNDLDDLLAFNSSGHANVVDSMSQWLDLANSGDLTTVQVFRDISGWNHFLLAWDTTQSTSTNRMRLYLNGTEITSFTTWNQNSANYPSQDYQLFAFSNLVHNIGRRARSGGTNYFNGYLAEFIAVDGTQIAPTDVGEFKNSIWVPKNPSGLTFGTNGFHLKFENASDLGNDSSGNNNDFTANNMGADHQVLDSPTFGG
tara:strand:- start:917 stop:1729 length:813 start_codon:yes stop_codon:yes gene_type:complete